MERSHVLGEEDKWGPWWAFRSFSQRRLGRGQLDCGWWEPGLGGIRTASQQGGGSRWESWGGADWRHEGVDVRRGSGQQEEWMSGEGRELAGCSWVLGGYMEVSVTCPA